MTSRIAIAVLILATHPAVGAAQEYEVARRSFPFIGDRLVVQVATENPGALRVVRGERGRVEVAGRAHQGFVGFGLGGELTPHLRLTAVGGDRVEYLVVIPEHVRLSVQLPEGRADLPPRGAVALYAWGAGAGDAGVAGAWPSSGSAPAAPLLPTRSGLLVAYSAGAAPALLEVADLGSVNSLSVRFQGTGFRIAASRALAVQPAAGGTLRLAAGGEPVDIVVTVPAGARFALHAAGRRLVHSAGGRPSSTCSGVAVVEPAPGHVWFTFHPRSGRTLCR